MQTHSRICLPLLAVLSLVFSMPAQAQVDEAAALEWAEQLQWAMALGRHDPSLIDDGRFVREALAVYQLDDDEVAMFETFSVSQVLIESVSASLGMEGTYTFLRLAEMGDQQVALFRLITPMGELNYHAWFLDTTDAGAVVGWDVEVFLTGERLSRTLRRMWIPVIADIDPEFERHMGDHFRLMVRHFDDISALHISSQAGRHARTIALFEALPGSLRDESIVMIAALNAYNATDDLENYGAVLERFNELHGNNSNAELIMVDILFLREDYDGALAQINALDERVGGDPYLYMYRASIANLQGDYGLAQRLIDTGLAEDELLLELVWASADFALIEEDWPRVSAMLTAAEGLGVELFDLTEVEGFEGYAASEEYARWLASRGGAEDAPDDAAE